MQQDRDEAAAPALRYSVGMVGPRVVVPLERLLPQRRFEWAPRRAPGLG